MPERDDAFFEGLVRDLATNIGDSVRSAITGASQKAGGDGNTGAQLAGGRLLVAIDSKSTKDIGSAIVGEMVSRKDDLGFGTGGGGKGKGKEKPPPDPTNLERLRLLKAILIQSKPARFAGDALADTIKYGNTIARQAAVTNNVGLRQSKMLTREIERFGIGLPEMADALNEGMRQNVGKMTKSTVALITRTKGYDANVSLQNNLLAVQTRALGRNVDSSEELGNDMLDLAHANDMNADALIQVAAAMTGLSKKQDTIFDPAVSKEFTEAAARMSTAFGGTRNTDVQSFLHTIGQGDQEGIIRARRLGGLLGFDAGMIETDQREYIVQAAVATARKMEALALEPKDSKAAWMETMKDAGISPEAANAMQLAYKTQGGEAGIRALLNQDLTPAERRSKDEQVQKDILKTSSEASTKMLRTAVAMDSLDFAMGLVEAKSTALATTLERKLGRAALVTSLQIIGMGNLLSELIHGAGGGPGHRSSGGGSGGLFDRIQDAAITIWAGKTLKSGATKLRSLWGGGGTPTGAPTPVPKFGGPGTKWVDNKTGGGGRWIDEKTGKPIGGKGSRTRTPAVDLDAPTTKSKPRVRMRGGGLIKTGIKILVGLGLMKGLSDMVTSEADDPRAENLDAMIKSAEAEHPERVNAEGVPLSELPRGGDRSSPLYVEEVVKKGLDDLGRSTTVTESVDDKGNRTRVTKTREESSVDLSTGPGGVPTGVNSLEELTKHIRMSEQLFAKSIEREKKLTPGGRMEFHSQKNNRMREKALYQSKEQYDAMGGEQSVVESLTDQVLQSRGVLGTLTRRGPRTGSQEASNEWQNQVYSRQQELEAAKASLQSARPNVTNAQELDKLAIFDRQMRMMDRVDAVDPNDPNIRRGVVGELPFEMTEEERNFGKFLPKKGEPGFDLLKPQAPWTGAALSSKGTGVGTSIADDELLPQRTPSPTEFLFPAINAFEAFFKSKAATKMIKQSGMKFAGKKALWTSPIVGSIAAYDRLTQEDGADVLGAGGEFISGLVGAIPHPITQLASAGMDATLLGRDLLELAGNEDPAVRNAKEMKFMGSQMLGGGALNPMGAAIDIGNWVTEKGLGLMGVEDAGGKMEEAKSSLPPFIQGMMSGWSDNPGGELVEYHVDALMKNTGLLETQIQLQEEANAYAEISAAEAVTARESKDEDDPSRAADIVELAVGAVTGIPIGSIGSIFNSVWDSFGDEDAGR